MPTLWWIVLSGAAMSALALTGAVVLFLPQRWFERMVLPMVALAAGALLGGALFHMLPEAVRALGDGLAVYIWVALGILSFLVLEQFLNWHHCHRPVGEHRPVGYLILIADAVHNLLGGLAVGGAFVVDVRLGIVTWLVAAAHEIPQELGDFGILVHSNWRPVRALAFNLFSALPFLGGGLIAYTAADSVDVAVLLPFAAGNFVYIAIADLLPEVTTTPPEGGTGQNLAVFALGLGALLALAALF
ncbi:ZIP family metal transporter [Nocardiopsis lucentensis]|uniref:ZIP family metal transporter n=1 Tax=Nocardiopsis lucentensis TaxID=53441 RepID=UPI0003478404|nr:ZIP family metal transporter [Nocardiopsis lucentensis]